MGETVFIDIDIFNLANLTLEDYRSLVLTNRVGITADGETNLGELRVVPITLSRVETQKELPLFLSEVVRAAHAKPIGNIEIPSAERGYIGISKEGMKLFYITFSYADSSYPFAQKVNQDLVKVQQSLRYAK